MRDGFAATGASGRSFNWLGCDPLPPLDIASAGTRCATRCYEDNARRFDLAQSCNCPRDNQSMHIDQACIYGCSTAVVALIAA
jgi:hypothetical protein